jgi:hypothetical protein
MPQARKLVTSDPYVIVRHPLYLLEEAAIATSQRSATESALARATTGSRNRFPFPLRSVKIDRRCVPISRS